jgi:hypothetical protein
MTATKHYGEFLAASSLAGSVKTTINYYLDPSEGGISWYTPGTAMIVRRKFDTRPVQIHDIRGHEAEFTINKQAFQLCKYNTAATEFTDEEIKKVMYPEVEELVKKV